MMMNEIVKILKKGGVGVMPTDTIYGIVGSALKKEAVAKIYRVKKRSKKSPLVVLIASLSDLKKFGVKPNREQLKIMKSLWSSGPVSVVIPVKNNKLRYIHRGTNSIAFRLPRKKKLRDFLKRTGPLVAPSANISYQKPAETIPQAEKYFGDKVDFYVDGGKISGRPSGVVAILR